MHVSFHCIILLMLLEWNQIQSRKGLTGPLCTLAWELHEGEDHIFLGYQCQACISAPLIVSWFPLYLLNKERVTEPGLEEGVHHEQVCQDNR
jgi:hypothetical protein